MTHSLRPGAVDFSIDRRDFIRFGLAGAGVLAAGGLSACGGDKPAQDGSGRQSVTIKYWTHDSVLSVPLLNYWAKELSSAPDSKYSYKIVPTIIPAADLATKARAAFLAKSNPPDLLNIEINAFSRFMDIAQDTLVDLTDAVKPVLDQNLPNLAEPYSVDGRPYGVELSPALCTFYYRSDEFKKLGLPEAFDTWDDLLAVAAKVTTPKGKYLGQVSGEGSRSGASYSFLSYLIQRGGGLFDRDGAVILDSPEAVEALAFMKRAVDEKVFLVLSGATTTGPQTVAFKKATIIGGLYADYYLRFVLSQLVPEQSGLWRMSTLPRFASGGSNTSILGGASFSIAKNSPVKDAALELLKRSVLTEEGQKIKYEQVNFKPTWLSVYEDPGILAAKNKFMGGQQINRVYAKLAPETPMIYQTPKWAPALELLNPFILAVFAGKTTPEQAIKDASAALSQIP